jgi:putative nucleotidyltransferase with HDIG domain
MYERLPGAPDIRDVAPDGSIGGELLRAMQQNLGDLPVLPEISIKVARIINQPDSSTKDITDLIIEDAVISAQVLKVANSAVYGGLSEITDLPTACTRLGMRTVGNIVQAIATADIFKTDVRAISELMKDIHRHSIITAHCAHELAVHLAEPKSDALFVAGLIHDIGKIALLGGMAKSNRGPLKQLHESEELFSDIIANYHTLAGLHVAQTWNLPPKFAMIAYYHHAPAETPQEDRMRSVHIVALANTLAHRTVGEDGEEEASLLSLESCRFLGLSDIKVATLRVDIEDRLAPLLGVLGLS